eukprot:TRINITY_DN30255_c0_g1_i13.p4 TRINITY_DN30255_c0_g1~~TRINITY_DN30255_c0_g1_i13.p4  ORF type:complete len:209 (+),score=-18.35 TRINITY_DN30255_c0_g1_i13:1004-1630(+)
MCLFIQLVKSKLCTNLTVKVICYNQQYLFTNKMFNFTDLKFYRQDFLISCLNAQYLLHKINGYVLELYNYVVKTNTIRRPFFNVGICNKTKTIQLCCKNKHYMQSAFNVGICNQTKKVLAFFVQLQISNLQIKKNLCCSTKIMYRIKQLLGQQQNIPIFFLYKQDETKFFCLSIVLDSFLCIFTRFNYFNIKAFCLIKGYIFTWIAVS